jgi:methylmalonyl-CoA/ethylmalonyl-CoA epimerase
LFKGVDHVVIAVNDLEAGIKQYEAIYGIPAVDRGEPPGLGLKNAYFRFGGDSYVEIVAPAGENSPIARRLAASGEGVYLLAMLVDDLEATLRSLRGNGVRLVGDPGEGSPVRGQVFVHPSATGGVLTQLVQR